MQTRAPSHGLPPELAADYEVVQVLGSGVSARVYLARQARLARTVVLKVMRGDERRFPTLRARFLQEAQLVARMQHPNVVELLDHGARGDVLYMSFPDLPGTTLDQVLACQRQAPVPCVVRSLGELLAALEHVHAAGIVHRDVKPANLLVTLEGALLLLDLGLARDLEGDGDLTATGAFLGTPLYAAPQQVMTHLPDPRDDLYAAGVVAYQMLSGDNPFRGRSAAEVLDNQLHVAPPLADEVRAEVPRGLALLVDRLLAKDREGRPDSAAQARAELEALGLAGAASSIEAVPEGQRRGTRVLGTALVAGAPAPSEAASAGPTPAPPTPDPRRAAYQQRANAAAAAAPPSGGLARRAALSAGAAGLLGLAALALRPGAGPVPPAPSPPATSSAPATGGSPFPADLAARALRSLEDTLSWRVNGTGEVYRTPGSAPAGAFYFREVSPTLTTRAVDAMDGPRQVATWLTEGGRPEDVPAATRDVLSGADARFRAAWLPGPFHPEFSELPPEAGPPDPALASVLEDVQPPLAPPAEVGPWLRLASQALARARRGVEELEAALDAGQVPRVALGVRLETLDEMVTPGIRPSRLVRAAMSGIATRVPFSRWMWRPAEAVDQMLYAAGRSMRDEPETRDLAALLVFDGLSGVRNVWFGAGTYRPAARLFGGPIDSWWLAVSAAMVEHLQGRVQSWVTGSRGGHPDRRLAYLDQAIRGLAPEASALRVHLESLIVAEVVDALHEADTPLAQVREPVDRARATWGAQAPAEAVLRAGLTLIETYRKDGAPSPPDVRAWVREALAGAPPPIQAAVRALHRKDLARLEAEDAEG